MCGRFAMNKETNEPIEQFIAQGGRAQDWRPSYSVPPTSDAPIINARMEKLPTGGKCTTVCRHSSPRTDLILDPAEWVGLIAAIPVGLAPGLARRSGAG